jgi:capsule polysaccharide export protein KpsE/RkpR
MTDQYDALDYVRRLEAAGVPKAQAEVHAGVLAHVLGNYVALPAHLNELKREVMCALSDTETRLMAEISGVRGEISQAESRLETNIAKCEFGLRTEMVSLEARLNEKILVLRGELKRLWWGNGVAIALLIAIFVQGYIR